MAGSEGFYIVAGPEFQRVVDRLGEVDPALPGQLNEALHDAAAPIIQDVQRAAATLPARGAKHTGLRGRLAESVGLQSAAGSSMRFVTSMDDPEEAALPRGMDNGAVGWRHPVYGNQNNWVQQHGGSWFREPIADDGGLVQENLTDVLEQVAAVIAAAGAGP